MIFHVRVYLDKGPWVKDYNIEALTPMGAQVKAFLRDGGGMCPDALGLVARARERTKVFLR